MPELKLPEVGEEVKAQARAYLNHILGDQQEITEQMVYVCARFAELRQSQPGFLRDLAAEDKPVPDGPTERAWAQFKSDQCPACGEKKRRGKDFFGPECWRILVSAKLHGELWQGWRAGRCVPDYIRALAFLRGQR